MARDPLLDLLASLASAFVNPDLHSRKATKPKPSPDAQKGGTGGDKAERLRRHAAKTKIDRFQGMLEHQATFKQDNELEFFAAQLSRAGQREVDRVLEAISSWARPEQSRRQAEPAIDAFSVDRIKAGIASTMADARRSLSGELDRLRGLGETRYHQKKAWFGHAFSSLLEELSRMRLANFAPSHGERSIMADVLRKKAEADRKQWHEYMAKAGEARSRELDAVEARLKGQAHSEYDLAAKVDPRDQVSFDALRIERGSRAIALIRPFPPGSARRTRSHFGGLPDLPAGQEWPRHELLGPLHFLVQIDLAEIHHQIDELPKRGTLLFFASLSNGKIAVPPSIIYDPDSAGGPAAAPDDFRKVLGDRNPTRRLLADGDRLENILPYWPIDGKQIETMPMPQALADNACSRPEFATYCRRHDSFRQAQFAEAAGTSKAISRCLGFDKRHWSSSLFAPHLTSYPWNWRGLSYVAQGLARHFQSDPQIAGRALALSAEARSNEPDVELPSAVRDEVIDLVSLASDLEDNIFRTDGRTSPYRLRSLNHEAIDRLLLDAAADPAVAAALPPELVAMLTETYIARPAGQMFGHLSSAYPVPDPSEDRICLLQLFREPFFDFGADEFRFVIARKALARGAWEKVELLVPRQQQLQSAHDHQA